MSRSKRGAAAPKSGRKCARERLADRLARRLVALANVFGVDVVDLLAPTPPGPRRNPGRPRRRGVPAIRRRPAPWSRRRR